jgi:hypothetical protein
MILQGKFRDGDFPAGGYTVFVPKVKSAYIDIQIFAGRVSFFTLYGSLTYKPPSCHTAPKFFTPCG